jgi:N4-gp56 family major capsid protein
LVLNEATIRLGVSMRQTEDELTRNVLAATASQIDCVAGVNGDNPTELTRADIDVVIATLLSNNAYTITAIVGGEDKFGTAPVRNSYIAMCHSDLTQVLDGIPGFTHVSQYPRQEGILQVEWGAISNMRYMISSIGSTSPNASNFGNTVYNIFCTGMESYGVVEQNQYSAQFLYLPPVFSGPLALNASVGWKMATAQRIYNDQWIINQRCTL